MKVRIKYVVEDTDRHGNVRVYLRKDGRKVRLRGHLGSPEFWREYHAALKPPPKVRGEKKTIPGTIQKGTPSISGCGVTRWWQHPRPRTPC